MHCALQWEQPHFLIRQYYPIIFILYYTYHIWYAIIMLLLAGGQLSFNSVSFLFCLTAEVSSKPGPGQLKVWSNDASLSY